MTIDCGVNPGTKVFFKLLGFIKPKSHALFYDLSINSRFTVLRNIYENFLIAAMKFHSYVRELPRSGPNCQTFYLSKLIV